LHGDDDATFLFEPLPDDCQPLPVCYCSSDLGPKGANLARFRGRLLPAPLREAEPGFGNPLLLGSCVFSILGRDSTVYDAFQCFPRDTRQTPGASTVFDALRQPTARIGRNATGSRAEDIGSET
jgi:hypothetical protein